MVKLGHLDSQDKNYEMFVSGGCFLKLDIYDDCNVWDVNPVFWQQELLFDLKFLVQLDHIPPHPQIGNTWVWIICIASLSFSFSGPFPPKVFEH